MAMVISQTTKAAIGGFLALMILGAVLVVGAAVGWFDPRREDEDTPAKVSARLQGRTSFVTHRAVSNQEGNFERQGKYYNIKNVCLSVNPLVILFARFKV
ncbi:hypothetical protein SFRURICE_002654 [Spodoptera frugiperda]|uniref:SFRICE_031351 n=1 Tax=Spodoptera frugiperda TaxID=7108 RepID=A0A2H1VTP9_SPOFR|nr:hypothetical protein SFRURICE_002654 [Spodoptera frugiperda]